MKINFQKIDHVQICIPIGEEEKGRAFYCDILGLKEIKRPESIKHIGGFWLEMANINLHIGTEKMEGKSKRHPAFEVENINEVKSYLISKGVKVKEDAEIPGISRFSFYDFWDNRIELIEKLF
ncbi:VOC family protein [Pseudotamlana carrageenivorans]|uniref:Glyoxalase n=1 Tax=Pseudotamlana carrageenivorans TaxID=2069432 RepID=A0A2I7SK76_9FLAO|nr:VOC family protein [Tamlana carrageenivorans]AUS06302.1 glyoxalase [Tamlana carrageenivorans]